MFFIKSEKQTINYEMVAEQSWCLATYIDILFLLKIESVLKN
jgi:hypothetical protein